VWALGAWHVVRRLAEIIEIDFCAIMSVLLMCALCSSGSLLIPSGIRSQRPAITPKTQVPSAEDGACAMPEPVSQGIVVLNKLFISGMKGVIDQAYAGRDFQRFYLLETIARVPYFAYLSCLHFYESLGMRSNVDRMRLHYAEADNELHHLLIMEHLGGNKEFGDRFVAQHMAFAYYWCCVAVYMLHPRTAYHLSELIEAHAFETYDAFLRDHESELRAQPVPEVARAYYGGTDAFDRFIRDVEGRPGRPVRKARALHSLYDVFCEIRDDEAAHWRTLCNLVQFEELNEPEGCSVSATDARLT
jgi:ubiquinol oxidase